MVSFEKLDVVWHWPWVSERANPILTEDSKGIVAIKDNKIIAACVLDNWTHTSCQIHIAIDDPIAIKHGFLHEICDYVFNTCKRIMVLGLTPSNNEKALRFNDHVGMKEIGVLKDAYDEGVDFIVTRMYKTECRWIDGKEKRAASA